MPFAIVVIGLALIVAAYRDKHGELAGLLVEDFTGPDNFMTWIIALLFIWAIGLYEPLEPISRAFMVLVLLVLFLKRGQGFFSQFTNEFGIR